MVRHAYGANSHELRLDRLVEQTGARGLDAILVTSDESIAYLTGFRPIQMERFFGVVVAPERSAVIVPALDRGQIDEAPRRLTRISYGAGIRWHARAGGARWPARAPSGSRRIT